MDRDNDILMAYVLLRLTSAFSDASKFNKIVTYVVMDATIWNQKITINKLIKISGFKMVLDACTAYKSVQSNGKRPQDAIG